MFHQRNTNSVFGDGTRLSRISPSACSQQRSISETGANNVRCRKSGYVEVILREQENNEAECEEGMDSRIDMFAQILEEQYSVKFTSHSSSTRGPVRTVGRISSGSKGRLNPRSLIFHTSQNLKESLRGVTKAILDLDGNLSFSLFAGQIIGVEGTFTSRTVMRVSKIYEPLPLSPLKMPLSRIFGSDGKQNAQKKSPMTIVISAGPYTTSDVPDNYQSFFEFLHNMRMEKPDALILIGPFVSQTRSTRMSPQAIFSAYISKPLEVFCSISPKTTVILVPSLEDKIYQPATFPQSAMTARSLKIPESVYSLPNPCSFQLNGIGIGVCTIDLLEHFANEEVTRTPKMDKTTRLARHILGQRSFYPFSPTSHINRDITMTPFSKPVYIKQAPDILILPSKQRHYTKLIDKVMVINPGHLTRSQSAGTYAKMTVQPTMGEDMQHKSTEVHIGSRIQASIVKSTQMFR